MKIQYSTRPTDLIKLVIFYSLFQTKTSLLIYANHPDQFQMTGSQDSVSTFQASFHNPFMGRLCAPICNYSRVPTAPIWPATHLLST